MANRFYSYEEFLKDIDSATEKLSKNSYNTIIAIGRGGLTASHFFGVSLNIRDVQTLSAISYSGDKKMDSIEVQNLPHQVGKKVLIVDDISDSGDTLIAVTEELKERFKSSTFDTYTIFYKSSSKFRPDLYSRESSEWIDFFWEVRR